MDRALAGPVPGIRWPHGAVIPPGVKAVVAHQIPSDAWSRNAEDVSIKLTSHRAGNVVMLAVR